MREAMTSNGATLDIACDESGSEGRNLLGGTTDVFTHASIRLSRDEARGYVEEIHERIGSSTTEYKSAQLLRERHRPILRWLLAPGGPLHGRSHVFLMEKELFAICRILRLFLDDETDLTRLGLTENRRVERLAVTFYRVGPRRFGVARWREFLERSNELALTMKRPGKSVPVDAFFGSVDALLASPPTGGGGFDEIRATLTALRDSRERAVDIRRRALENQKSVPALDPLIRALVTTVDYWGRDGTPVSIDHDEQSALTEERIDGLRTVLAERSVRLIGVRRVDSRDEPRVQLADFLAGIALRVASEELHGRSDPALLDLLRPYVDPRSMWGDERSWTRLGWVAAADEERSSVIGGP